MNSSTTAPWTEVPFAWRYAALIGVVAVLFLFVLAFGSVPLAPQAVVEALFGQSDDVIARSIVRELRLPRAVTAILAGSALAVSGLLMQTVFRNPLAGPGIMGVNATAGLAVAAVVMVQTSAQLFGVSTLWLAAIPTGTAAVFGAGFALLLIAAAAQRMEDPTTVLLLGVLLGYASSALTTVLTAGSGAEQLQRYLAWSYGTFNAPLGPLTAVLGVGLLGTTGWVWFSGPRIDALLLGPRHAATLGVAVVRTQRGLLLAAGTLAGLTTALCGPVGFIGVVVPHIARAVVPRTVHRFTVPAALLCGSALALAADLVAHLPGAAHTLPLNAVTALVGVPVVLTVLVRHRRLGAGG